MNTYCTVLYCMTASRVGFQVEYGTGRSKPFFPGNQMRAAGPQPQPSQTRPIPQLVAITQHLLPDRTKRASSPRQNQTQLQPLSTLSLLPAAKALQLPAIGVPPYRLSPEKRRHNHEHEASHDLTGKKHQGKPTKRSFPAAQPFCMCWLLQQCSREASTHRS